jgi:septum formation protein
MAEAERVELILASRSVARQHLLSAAGLVFRVVPSTVDEQAIRSELRRLGGPCSASQIAEQLAAAKARQVSRDHRSALVIGADQVLALGQEVIPKPGDVAEARHILLKLRGKTHHLHTSVALARAGDALWSHGETAELTMREFSSAFLSDYLARCGPDICNSVGAYEIEALGVQLFERIAGDHFAILGLPLLPLLGELRARGILAV